MCFLMRSTKGFLARAIESDLAAILTECPSAELTAGPVYRKAAYFTWSGRGPVVLLTRDLSPQPWAVVTDDIEFSEGASSDALFILKGRLFWRNHELFINPNETNIFDSSIPDLSQVWHPVYLEQARTLGWSALIESLVSQAGPLGQLLSDRIILLQQGLCSFDLSLVKAAVSSLVGLGYGVTPTGDDFLTGFLSIMAAKKHPYFNVLSDAIMELILESNEITTVPGGVSLWHACHGRFAKVITDTVLAINGFGDIEAAIRSLVSVGHTSGRDILAGIVHGVLY